MARKQIRLRKRQPFSSSGKSKKGHTLQAKFNAMQPEGADYSTAMGQDAPLVQCGSLLKPTVEPESGVSNWTEIAARPKPTLQMKGNGEMAHHWWQKKLKGKSHAPSLQREITVGKPGDKYEKEADAVAAEVTASMRSPETEGDKSQGVQKQEEDSLQTFSIQRKVDGQGLKAPSLQREEMATEEDNAMVQGDSLALDGGTVSPEFEQELKDKKRSGGESLSGETQEAIADKTGWQTDSVKIHTDVEANQLSKAIGAKSFTSENHIFYADSSDYGRDLKSSSPDKQHLMLHEITHSRQQGALQAKTSDRYGVNPQTTPALSAKMIQRMTLWERMFGVSPTKRHGVSHEAMKSAPTTSASERFVGRTPGIPKKSRDTVKLGDVWKNPYAWELFKKHLKDEFSIENALFLDEFKKRGYSLSTTVPAQGKPLLLSSLLSGGGGLAGLFSSSGGASQPLSAARPISSAAPDTQSDEAGASEPEQHTLSTVAQNLNDLRKIQDIQGNLYEKFIKQGSDFEINIASETRAWFTTFFSRVSQANRQHLSAQELHQQVEKMDSKIVDAGAEIFALCKEPFSRFRALCPTRETYKQTYEKRQEKMKKSWLEEQEKRGGKPNWFKKKMEYSKTKYRDVFTKQEKRAERAFRAILGI